MMKNNGEEPFDWATVKKIPYSEWLSECKKKGIKVPDFSNVKFKEVEKVES
ncbi:MAG TPA: hypothetical protein VN368_02015 [Candidatus Methylomirabilis sp.]|nr:hypothetical protein [Candidatus Methylomirabilis sp.]